VPHSTGNGTTLHDQHLGPRAVRNVSALGRRVHKAFGLDPWNMARIHDLGDVALPELNDNEASVQRMTDFFSRVDRAGSRPVSIGGDHAITGGILQAIAGPGAGLTGGRPASLLHFDAHTDAFDHIDHFFGAKKSAAHWASYLTRGGHVDHAALEAALRAGTIAGAVLDVTDPEPLPDDSGLWTLPSCVITPHIGNTREMGLPLITNRVRENVRRWLAGEHLLGLVDVALGY